MPVHGQAPSYYPFLERRPEAGLKVVEADLASLPSKLGDAAPKSLTDLLPVDVNALESILRQPAPGQDATAIQRESFLNLQNDKIDAVLSPLAGQLVTVQFLVVDVVDRGRLSPAVDAHFGKYFVAAQMEWRAPFAYSPAENAEVNRIQAEYKQQIAAANGNSRQNAAQARANAEQTRSKALAAVHDEADGRRPIHLVYLFSDDPAALNWKRGELHAVIGVIQKAGIRVCRPKAADPVFGKLLTKPAPVGVADEFAANGGPFASASAMAENHVAQAYANIQAASQAHDPDKVSAAFAAFNEATARATLQDGETIGMESTLERAAQTNVLMEFVISGFTGPEPKLIVTKPTASNGPATKPAPTTKPAGKITIMGGRSAGTEYGK
jgi:hypothetical protein